MGQLRTGTMTTRLELGAERPGLRLGFTLVELIVVMAIIGIILAFLLIAAGDARRRAEQDATLALITKLEGGINDRLDALLQTRPDPTSAHVALANIYYSGDPRHSLAVPPGPRSWPTTITSKASCPTSSSCRTRPAPIPSISRPTPYPGRRSTNLTRSGAIRPATRRRDGCPCHQAKLRCRHSRLGEGIYGASYSAAAGIYKNLGYLPRV